MSGISSAAMRALAGQKEASLKETRAKLECAIQRLTAGTPLQVSPGAKINAMNVAREADVDRATLYRFHKPVLEKIRQITAKKSAVASAAKESKEREYRRLVEEAQKQVEALARINYQLETRIDELTDLLSARDHIINELRENPSLSASNLVSSVRPLRKPR